MVLHHCPVAKRDRRPGLDYRRRQSHPRCMPEARELRKSHLEFFSLRRSAHAVPATGKLFAAQDGKLPDPGAERVRLVVFVYSVSRHCLVVTLKPSRGSAPTWAHSLRARHRASQRRLPWSRLRSTISVFLKPIEAAYPVM